MKRPYYQRITETIFAIFWEFLRLFRRFGSANVTNLALCFAGCFAPRKREQWDPFRSRSAKSMKFRRFLTSKLVIFLPLALVSCGEEPPEKPKTQANNTLPETQNPPSPPSKPENEPEKPESPGDNGKKAPSKWTEQDLHAALKVYNPGYKGSGQFRIEEGMPIAISLGGEDVDNLTPLAGLKLRAIDLQGTKVKNLRPLAGMPLEEVFLEQTPVEDLTPLRGAPIKTIHLSASAVRELTGLEGAPLHSIYAVNTRIADLTPLKGSSVDSIWLTGCPIKDLSPLADCKLTSVTLHMTPVSDLRPLAATGLKRLHIGETQVEDLTPIAGLPLTRLVFTPPLIKKGIEDIRKVPTLQEIGTRFDDGGKDLMPPARFWPMYDEFVKSRDQGAPDPKPEEGN